MKNLNTEELSTKRLSCSYKYDQLDALRTYPK